jgi:hypothetical protein
VEIVEQLLIGLRRQLAREFVEAAEKWKQVWLGIGGRHGSDGFMQFNQRAQNGLFGCGHEVIKPVSANSQK